MGVEVHFFIGNHDIWCGDYLTKECGVIMHREPLTTEIYGKEFYLAHGDAWVIRIRSSSYFVRCSTAKLCKRCFLLFIPAGVLNWV